MIAFLLAACAEDTTPGTDDTPPPTEPEDTDVPPIPDDTGDTDSTTTPGLVTDVVTTQNTRIGSIVGISWVQSLAADAHVEFSFDDGVWVSSPTRSLDVGPQEELLLGVPYDEEITWRLVVTDGVETFTSPDAVVSNGPIPADAPVLKINASDPARYDAAGAPYFMVGLPELGKTWGGSPWWEIIIDRQGRVVWALRSPFNRSFMHARVALDGKSLLLDHNSFWPDGDGGAASEIERTAIDGTVLHTYATPGMHHPFTDLPDGSIAYGAEAPGGEHILIVHEDGTTEDIFDCEDWLQSHGGGNCASNTLTYDEPSNKFLFSHYSIGTIIEVDRTTGNVDRWWGEANTPWVFDPPNAQFTWQHGGHIEPSGTLVTSSLTVVGPSEIVAREHEIDDATQTLHQIHAWGVGDGLYGDVMGEAFHLPNGNLVHNTGGLARIREFAADDDTVVWDVEWANDAIGRSMPIVDLYALKP